MNINWCKQSLRSEVVPLWNRLFRVLHKTARRNAVVTHIPYSCGGERASLPFPGPWGCSSLSIWCQRSPAHRAFWVLGDSYFVSTVFFVKPAIFPELKQKQQKRSCSKVGVLLARGGTTVGVRVDWRGALAVSSETSPGRSSYKKCNIIISAAH